MEQNNTTKAQGYRIAIVKPWGTEWLRKIDRWTTGLTRYEEKSMLFERLSYASDLAGMLFAKGEGDDVQVIANHSGEVVREFKHDRNAYSEEVDLEELFTK